MANAAGNMMAAPAPCTARAATIQLSAKLPLGVRPQKADATANTTIPTTRILVCPTVSASRPPNANSAAKVSM